MFFEERNTLATLRLIRGIILITPNLAQLALLAMLIIISLPTHGNGVIAKKPSSVTVLSLNISLYLFLYFSSSYP